MKRLIITCGISASGKSTWVRDFLESSSLNWVVINRDNLRKSLFSYSDKTLKNYYSDSRIGFRENFITQISKDLNLRTSIKNANLIIDNTHLQFNYLKEIIEMNKDLFDIKIKVFEKSLSLCVEHDKARKASVGQEILNRQLTQFNKLKRNQKFKEYLEKYNFE